MYDWVQLVQDMVQWQVLVMRLTETERGLRCMDLVTTKRKYAAECCCVFQSAMLQAQRDGQGKNNLEVFLSREV